MSREKDLEAEIAKLREQLALVKTAPIPVVSAFVEERATGETVSMKLCANPWVKDEKKQNWVDAEVPTFDYTVTLPKGAGTHLSTNGIEYYHGQTYRVDQYQLVELKSRVARCWDHEKMIHGDNENAYRKPTEIRLYA